MVWALSSFLDNIAAALMGGAMAHQLFRAKVHIGYLAAIVAASNAGGSWSVIAHTTTKMMWIAGVSPRQVFEAIIASIVALLVFGIPAAIKQPRHSPILKHAHEHVRIDAASSAEEFDFLLLLVLIASMMLVERLPNASSRTALGLSFLSSVFDNIPLTILALKQGGYD